MHLYVITGTPEIIFPLFFFLFDSIIVCVCVCVYVCVCLLLYALCCRKVFAAGMCACHSFSGTRTLEADAWLTAQEIRRKFGDGAHFFERTTERERVTRKWVRGRRRSGRGCPGTGKRGDAQARHGTTAFFESNVQVTPPLAVAVVDTGRSEMPTSFFSVSSERTGGWVGEHAVVIVVLYCRLPLLLWM